MEGSTILTINKAGVIQSVDKNCCRMFGYDLEELIGHNVKVIIPSPYKEQHETYLRNYMRTQVPRIIARSRIVEGQHKDGTIFTLRISVTKVGEGEDVMFVGMLDKVDDKSVTITINSSGAIVSCGHNVEEIFGYKVTELSGKNVSMLVAPPHHDHHDEYIKQYLAGGQPRVIGKARNVMAQHKSGTIFPICLQVEHVRMGPVDLFRAKIEKVESMEALFTLDESGTIVGCNYNFVLPLFGYTNEELMNKNIDMLIPGIFDEVSKTLSDLALWSSITHATLKNEGETPLPIPLSAPLSVPLSNSTTSSGISEPPQSDDASSERQAKRHKPNQPGEDTPWQNLGEHLFEVRHKDGSKFSTSLEVHPFTDPNNRRLFYVRLQRIQLTPSDKLSDRSIGEYYLTKTIGQGTYGKVKLGIHKRTKQHVAVKILSKREMGELEFERARREIEILHQLKHPHIAKLYEVIESEETLNLILEYGGRTLLSYVMERRGLPEDEARVFFKMIVDAIHYCHGHSIIHRDIKHQNILLDENMQVKVIDFGLSNFMQEGKLRSTFCGTPAYAAPEMIMGRQYSGPEVDVWSLGVVLYSMIVGGFPFQNVSDILNGNFSEPPNLSPGCCKLLKRMLTVTISDRYTIQDILSDPWVTTEPSRILSPSKVEVETTAPSSEKEATK